MKLIDDSRPTFSPTCATCIHLKSVLTPMCDAFPTENGIPLEIWTGKNDHRTPHIGDHNIQYTSCLQAPSVPASISANATTQPSHAQLEKIA